MKLISAFLSFTFTIMFVLFAYELARFLKCQLQTMFKALFKKKFRKKKVSFEDVEAMVNSETFDDIQVLEQSSEGDE